MSTLYLTNVTVSSHYGIRGEGWMNVYLTDGHILTVHCPKITDNWVQNTKRLCTQSFNGDEQKYQIKSLLLQSVKNEKGYIILQAEIYSPQSKTHSLFNIPASEIQYMLNRSDPQKILGGEFLMMVFIIFAALYALKYLLEKYLLKKFSD